MQFPNLKAKNKPLQLDIPLKPFSHKKNSCLITPHSLCKHQFKNFVFKHSPYLFAYHTNFWDLNFNLILGSGATPYARYEFCLKS